MILEIMSSKKMNETFFSNFHFLHSFPRLIFYVPSILFFALAYPINSKLSNLRYISNQLSCQQKDDTKYESLDRIWSRNIIEIPFRKIIQSLNINCYFDLLIPFECSNIVLYILSHHRRSYFIYHVGSIPIISIVLENTTRIYSVYFLDF